MSIDSAASPHAVDRPNDPATSSYDAGRTEQAAPPQPANEDTRGQRRAETLTREEYADTARAGGPPIQDARDGHQAADGNESRRQADTVAVAEPLTREEYADAVRGSAAVPAVTHFHGEFKGRPLDLYTDGTRWAAADAPNMDETVSEKALCLIGGRRVKS